MTKDRGAADVPAAVPPGGEATLPSSSDQPRRNRVLCSVVHDPATGGEPYLEVTDSETAGVIRFSPGHATRVVPRSSTLVAAPAALGRSPEDRLTLHSNRTWFRHDFHRGPYSCCRRGICSPQSRNWHYHARGEHRGSARQSARSDRAISGGVSHFESGRRTSDDFRSGRACLSFHLFPERRSFGRWSGWGSTARGRKAVTLFCGADLPGAWCRFIVRSRLALWQASFARLASRPKSFWRRCEMDEPGIQPTTTSAQLIVAGRRRSGKVEPQMSRPCARRIMAARAGGWSWR